MIRASGALISAVMLPAVTGASGCACTCTSDAGATKGSVPVAAMKDQDAAASTYRGVLHTGMMGIGGEHTGFEVWLDDGTHLEVEPGTARAAAEGLDGRRVLITGSVGTRGYVERGRVKILNAELITPEGAGVSK